MADQSPASNDIQLIFKKLRSLGPNKVCFDCSAKNPTWASVTYGVFICIDCSAVHRSLGVHLTFVRSTQLDTNWTWLQIRQMQLGGNGNAQTFFQQHNCTTKDAQQKYNSRAAQLYKEKLHNLAIQAIRTHGTKLHIESHDASHGDHENKEVDFFEEHQISDANEGETWPEGLQVSSTNGAAVSNTAPQPAGLQPSGPQPNVDAILTNMATISVDSDRKSTITQRKPIAKKTGLGAKKGGLGAQRVKTNFADIEQKAVQADKDRERAEEEAKVRAEKTAEEEQKQLASMRLAYQDLSQLKKKEEDKLRNVDPKKAQQLERLGMGFASKSGVSHSVMTDMQVIEQDAPVKSNTINLGRSLYDRDDFLRDSLFDDRDDLSCTSRSFGLSDDRPMKDLVVMLMDSNMQDESPSSSSKSGWESGSSKLNWDNKSEWESNSSPPKAMSLSSSSSSRSSRPPAKAESSRSTSRDSASKGSSATSPTTAQQKFGSAKAISSDQYFSDSTDQTWERKANLSRFEGSSSISSADFFNGDSNRSSGSGASSSYSGQFVAPDLEDVKESVRQGVTKVAGKLSSLANGVVSTIQERYGNY